MASVKIHVCQSTSCSSLGSAKLACDMEELCVGSKCEVAWGTCVDHCGKGPNVKIEGGGKKAPKILEHMDSFKKVEQMLSKEAGVKLAKDVRAAGEIKYEVRRGKNADARSNLIDKAFKAVGGDAAVAKSNPQLAAELLVLRSREQVAAGGVVGGASDSNGEMALEDGNQAVKLAPKFARAHIAVAFALERLGRWEEAEQAIATAEESVSASNGLDRKDFGPLLKKLEGRKKEAGKAAKEAAEKERAEEEAKTKAEADAEAAAAVKKKAADAAAKKKAVAKKAEDLKKKQIEEAHKKKEQEHAEQQRAAEEVAAQLEAEQQQVEENTAKQGDELQAGPTLVKCPPLSDRIVSL